VREGQLLTHALQRLVEAEPGLDADDEQVEDVGQSETHAMLPALRQPREHHGRQHVTQQTCHERDEEIRLDDDRQREQREGGEGDAQAQAEEHDQGLVAAVTAAMSRCCSLPFSDADRGATSPRRFNAFTIFLS